MTALVHRRVYQFANNMIEEAIQKGYTQTNPVVIEVTGGAIQGDLVAPTRKCYISYKCPDINADTIIWINPVNRKVYKGNPAHGKWHRVYEFEMLFLWVEWQEVWNENILTKAEIDN